MGYRWDTDGIQNHLENHPRNHNWLVTITSMYIPSGKYTKNYGKIHHFQWVNPLFRLGHFPVRYVTNYQRV